MGNSQSKLTVDLCVNVLVRPTRISPRQSGAAKAVNQAADGNGGDDGGEASGGNGGDDGGGPPRLLCGSIGIEGG